MKTKRIKTRILSLLSTIVLLCGVMALYYNIPAHHDNKVAQVIFVYAVFRDIN